MATNSVDVLGPGRTGALTGSRKGFYFGMAVVLAATVFIGFSPSFYLRAVLAKPLHVPPLSTALLVVHGSVMTVWMLLLLAQTGLVKAGRVELHRRFGVFAAAWAVLMVCVVLVTAIVQAHRAVIAGTPPSNFNTLSSISDIALFGVLIGVAVRLRRSPGVHRRLMILATVLLMTPATFRTFNFLLAPLGLPLLPVGILIGLGLPTAYVLAVAVHDLVTLRRIHPATIWGGVPILMWEALIVSPFYASSLATELTHKLAGLY